MNHAGHTASNNTAVPDTGLIEQLLRYLDGTLPQAEEAVVAQRLTEDPAARALLRDLAEQIICIGETERRLETPVAVEGGGCSPPPTPRHRQRRFLRWQSVALTLLASIIVAASGYSAWTFGRLPPVRVSRAVGATRLFSSVGTTLEGIPEGQQLRPGDTLASRASDAWITTDLIGGQLTIAGDSVLRVLRPVGSERRFELVEGSLWIDAGPGGRLGEVVVQTPTATVQARGCLFDVRTSATDSLVRVHRGQATVSRQIDAGTVSVTAGEQVKLSLDRSQAPTATSQPLPIHRWALDLDSAAMVSHGIVLPASEGKPTRLAAIPLLWKEGVESPLLLYPAGVAAWLTTESPLEIRADSVITFRGLMEARSGIRVGMTTQRMQGVFAGKFGVTIPPDDLVWDGQQWEVALDVSEFEAMNPQLATSPIGLEVGDLYAMTLDPEAKLQLTGISITDRGQSLPPQNTASDDAEDPWRFWVLPTWEKAVDRFFQ